MSKAGPKKGWREGRDLSHRIRFGRTLRGLRKAQGLSLNALGAVVGLSGHAVGFWERGRCEPDLEALVALADLFEIGLDELVGRTNDDPQ